MATGGGKPGVTFRAKVISMYQDVAVLQAVNDKPSDYLVVGDEYVVQLVPAPSEHPAGDAGQSEGG